MRNHIRALLVALGVVIGFALLRPVANVLVVPPLAAAGVSPSESPQVVSKATAAVFYLLAIGAGLALLSRWADREGTVLDLANVDAPNAGDLGAVAAGLAADLLLTFGSDALYGWLDLGVPASHSISHAPEPSIATFAAGVVVTAFLLAPAEELVFRRIVLDRLRRNFGTAVALVVAAALFAVPHAGNYPTEGLAFNLLPIFASGLLLGGLYLYTENLLVPIAVHAAHNVTLDVLIELGAVG